MSKSPKRQQPALVAQAGRTLKVLAVLLVVAVSGAAFATVLAALPTSPTGPTTPSLTAKPANPTNGQSASFSFTGAKPGATYRCQLDSSPFAACTSPKTYAGPLDAGWHTFTVKAVAATGQTQPTTYSWRIDTTRPPTPVLTSHPSTPTSEKKATFTFTDTEAGVGFRCQIDGGGFAACTSGKTYNGLAEATHTFAVRAIDQAGNVSPTTTFSWSVESQLTNFKLSGTLYKRLYPGAVAAFDVRITNPYNFGIKVSGLTVEVRPSTTKNGSPNPACSGTTNLVMRRQYSGPASLIVAKDSTKSLTDLGVPPRQWPQLLMPNLSTNQDACKNTKFTFSITANATKATP